MRRDRGKRAVLERFGSQGKAVNIASVLMQAMYHGKGERVER